MPSPTPPSRKRARLDDALHRPFRSPLRHEPFRASRASSPGTSTVGIRNPSPAINALSAHPITAQHDARAGQVRRLSNVSPTLGSTSPNQSTIHRALEAQIRTLRSQIDVLIQANRILSSNRQDELTTLNSTWNRTARAAAEELFVNIKDKVNQMGGVGAWRDNERQREDRRRDWDRQARENEVRREMEELEDEGLEEEERDGETSDETKARIARSDKAWDAKQARKEMLEQMRGESTMLAAEAAEHEGCRPKTDLEYGDEFTMDMMLRTMGVDLGTIGYDNREQRWTD